MVMELFESFGNIEKSFFCGNLFVLLKTLRFIEFSDGILSYRIRPSSSIMC
jgi:hypothetical protein